MEEEHKRFPLVYLWITIAIMVLIIYTGDRVFQIISLLILLVFILYVLRNIEKVFGFIDQFFKEIENIISGKK